MLASDERRPRALVLSPEAPYPLDGGGALRTASLLQYLCARFEVTLIAFQHPGQQILQNLPAGLVGHARVLELRKHANSFMAKALRNGQRLYQGRPPLIDRFSGYEDKLRKLLVGHSFDVAVLEHFWTASYLRLIRQFANRVVLDLHNVESSWHLSCAAAAQFPHSLMHRSFGDAAARLERLWLPLCDLALATSQQDKFRLKSLCPGLPVCIYPNAIPFRGVTFRDPDFAIGFSGNMEYEPNRAGLKWFVSQVWPTVQSQFPGLVLRLIGKNPDAIQNLIRDVKNIECTGWVADPFVSLSAVQLCIAPLLSGSGTRLKIIEAWAAGRAVVATTVGAEGLDAQDGISILIADTPIAFGQAISKLLTDRILRQKIANSGRELFLQKYTWNVAWKTLDVCLNADNPEERVRL